MQHRTLARVPSGNGRVLRMAGAFAMALFLAACAGMADRTEPIGPGVRAVVNVEGEVIGYRAFRQDTRRWYDAELTGETTAVLSQRGQLRYVLDRARLTRGR